MLRATCVLAASLLVWSSAAGGQERSPWADTDTTHVVPVTFSFSGAISMGVYQAGVNWALGQFINLTHDNPIDSPTGQSYRAQKRLPRIDIAALSGASAGNINAVLAAIEYCDTTEVSERKADSSLFWKMWVLSGWDDLMPPEGILEPGDDPGIFSRKRLADYIEKVAISEALANRRHRVGCRIPVGIVVTKIDPATEITAGGLEARTQRFVVPFEMREVAGKLRFAQVVDAVRKDRPIGSQIFVGEPGEPFIAESSIFQVVEASASYPIAFAPVTLAYRDARCFGTPWEPACAKPKSAPFMDGGAFDVLPLSVADKLYRVYNSVLDKAGKLEWGKLDPPRLLFVDVGRPRGALERHRQQKDSASASKRAQGVDAIVRFLGGFVPSAREYERHVFARTADNSAWYVSTARALPAVSEHMGYFAGFFGRPFREVDFYAGVADGLYYVAREILCDPVRVPAPQGADSLTKAALRERCTEAEVRNLATQRLAIGNMELHLLDYLMSRSEPALRIFERGSAPWPFDAQRLRVLKAIVDAELSLMTQPAGTCEVQGLVTAALCGDGFKAFLNRLRADSANVVRVFQDWSDSPACDKTPSDQPRERCLAEKDLAQLVAHPELQMHAYIGDALRRMRSAEEIAGGPASRFLMRAGELAYRSTDYRYRRGIEFDPSSIPPYERALGWGALSVLPYYAGTTVGVRGLQLGWQPTWHNPARRAPWLAFAVPFSISSMADLSAAQTNHWYVSASPSLVWKRNSLFNQFQVGARAATCVGGSCSGKLHFGAEATAHLASKLRLSVFPHVSGTNGRKKLAGSISIADLNGILYWAIRK